jgi:hypothetical protein
MIFAALLALTLTPLRIPVAGKPDRIATADMNLDGKIDLVVGCDRAISVLLGDGRGGFRESSRLAVNGQPTEFAIADFNRDGSPDVAFADHDTLFVFVLAGDGKGGLTKLGQTRVRPTGRPHVHGLAAGDWNRDGKPDLAHFNIAEHEIVLLEGDGRGEMSPVKTIASSYPNNPLTFDGNGDGITDLAVPDTAEGTVHILLGDGRGGFVPAPGSPHRISDRPLNAAAGDWNGDGHTDLAITHDDIARMTLLLGDGRGGFRLGPVIDMGENVYGVAFVGRKVVTATDRAYRIVADGEAMRRIERPKGNWRVVVADVNGDGHPDLLDTSPVDGEVRIYLGPITNEK